MPLTSAFAILLTLSAGQQPSEKYARPELLVEATKLLKLVKENARVLDARPRDKYDEGHASAAAWVDHDAWSKAFAQKQDPEEWAKKIGALGIDSKTRVIIYDDNMSKDAARIWWILRYWGVKDVRLVNGGFPAYKDAEMPVSKTERDVPKSDFKAAPDKKLLASKEDVLGILKEKKTQIVDARSAKEYCGDDKKAKKGGAIPGAVNLEWSDALDPKTQRFKSPAELTKLLKDAGIDLARPIVTHCQSGGRSAVMAFTLELMGAKEVANYYRGWSEWGNSDDTPIVTPEKKK